MNKGKAKAVFNLAGDAESRLLSPPPTPILAPIPCRPIKCDLISDETLDQLPKLENMSDHESTSLGSPLVKPMTMAHDPGTSSNEDARAALTTQGPATSPTGSSGSTLCSTPSSPSSSILSAVSDPYAGIQRIYSRYQLEYPPTDKFFSLQHCQGDNATQRAIRRRDYDFIYPSLLEDPDRIIWESRFMDSFWWYPWRSDSTESVFKWVQERRLHQDWSDYAKDIFRETVWSVYDREAWRQLEHEPVRSLDFITHALQNACVAVGIYNLAIVRCFDNGYVFFPMGYSRPVYSSLDLGIVEEEFIKRWYPQYLKKVVQGPGESAYDLGRREYCDLLNCIQSYYGFGKPPAALNDEERFV